MSDPLRNIALGEEADAIGWRDAEIERLNAQTLALVAEISGLRRELAEAQSDLAAAERGHDAAHAACVKYDAELAEARAALASATIDTWWAKAYFKKYPEAATSDQPREVVCSCDDHDARYCVNRISRTVRCGCKCHQRGASDTDAHSGADTTTATPPTLLTSTDKSTGAEK